MADRKVRVISAPSILGLKPTGVELLADRIILASLPATSDTEAGPLRVPDLNHLYNSNREPDTGCLNTAAIKKHALLVGKAVTEAIADNAFALVLGGDCSILIGVMAALKQLGKPGLVFLDAHADFYSPERSITGEVADMDLAIVTGNGPELLTDINNQRPYVAYENVIHIGQRDQEEAATYQSPDIRLTDARCFSADTLKSVGIDKIIHQLNNEVEQSTAEMFWIHFDTDVLDDEINPAVDYRIAGGLKAAEVSKIIEAVLATHKCVGMTVTIYNPVLDTEGRACEQILSCLTGIFD